jgi:hypothetical protein
LPLLPILGSQGLRGGLDETHKVPLRVGEHRDAWTFRHVLWAHDSAAPKALNLAQRCLEVWDLYVEGDVALVEPSGAVAPTPPLMPSWAPG